MAPTNRIVVRALFLLVITVFASSCHAANATNLCGPECLYVAMRGLSPKNCPASFRAFVKTFPSATKTGYSLADLYDKAKENGLDAELLRTDSEKLVSLAKKYYVILHLTKPGHFVLCEQATAEGVQIFDPQKKSYFLPVKMLAETWEGNCLVLSNSKITQEKISFLSSSIVFGFLAALLTIVVLGFISRSWIVKWFSNVSLKSVLAIAVLLTLVTGCNTHSSVVSSKSVAVGGTTSELSVIGGAVRSLGIIKAGDEIKESFTIMNLSSGDLVIDQVKPSCSCAFAVVTPQRIRSGETCSVQLTVDTKNSIASEASAVIVTNLGKTKVEVSWAVDTPFKSLAKVFPMIEVGVDSTSTSSAELVGNVDFTKLKAVSLVSKELPGLSHSAKIDGNFCQIEIVTDSMISAGLHRGCVEITEAEGQEVTLRIPWTARVSSPLQVFPSEISFRKGEDKKYVAQFIVDVLDEDDLNTIRIQTVPDQLASLKSEISVNGPCACAINLELNEQDSIMLNEIVVTLEGKLYRSRMKVCK